LSTNEPHSNLPKPWLIEDVDLMIEALSFLDNPEFEYETWIGSEMRVQDGMEVWSLPYPQYSEAVDRYFDLCYESSCVMDCYVVLPEDPEGAIAGPELAELFQTEREFYSLTLNQVRRYLYLCTRGEKFCDGYIGGQIRNGRLVGAYRRLVDLRRQMG
jgi:hypothetical protein